MAERVGYDQILREVAAKRGLKPWEVAFNGPAGTPPAAGAAPMQPVDPLAMAAKRAELMQALGQLGPLANPETEMANAGQKPNAGLMQLLMGLMKK